MFTEDEWDEHWLFGDAQPQQVDKWLFHYTSIDRAASIALLRSLSLGPLDGLNDPRESIPRGMATFTAEDPISPDEREVVYKAILSRRRSQVRVACFTRDGDAGEPRTAMRADACGFARSRMWAQYGDGHKGVCLIFDRQALVNAGRTAFADLISRDVGYMTGFDEAYARSNLVDLDWNDADAHFESEYVPSLFSKNSDWAAEREHRLVLADFDNTSALIPVDGCLVGLVAGVDFRPHRLPVLGAIAKEFGVEEAVAHLFVHDAGVLAPLPIEGADGKWHIWTDADVRDSTRIFAEPGLA